MVATSLLSVSVALQIHFGSAYRDSVAFVVDPVLVAVLIVQAIAFRDTLPWRFLQVGWVRYLGRISYSIYIYQQVMLYSVSKRRRYDAVRMDANFWDLAWWSDVECIDRSD